MEEDINEILKEITNFGGYCGGYTDIHAIESVLDGCYTSKELRTIADVMDRLKENK